MSMRCFAAVEVSSADLVAALGRVQSGLQHTGLGAKWVPAHNWHLTLKFLGEIPEGRVSCALLALRRAAAGITPFDVEIRGLGAFPALDGPRVLWAGIGAGRRSLEELAEAVEKEMEIEGFSTEQRRFSPHLTLGRIPEGAPIPPRLPALLREGASTRFGIVRIAAAVLMKSDLRPAGPVYTPLGQVGLMPG